MGSALGSIFGGGQPSSLQKGATAQQEASLSAQRNLDKQGEIARKRAEQTKLKKGKASLALIKSKQSGGAHGGTAEELMTGRGKLLGN
jgi:hypothetical protein